MDPVRAHNPRQAGFTLLEIMVVLILIGISTAFVVLNIDRDSDSLAELEARRFASLIEHARDESILSGRPFAVSVDPTDKLYAFLQYDGEWSRIEGDDIFRVRHFPADLDIAFETGGSPDARGLLVIQGLGIMTPFVLTVGGESTRYRVTIDPGGNVVVSNDTNATS